MSKMMICPECKSTATKRLIVEWTVKEFVALLVFPVLLNLRFPRYKCKSCGKKFKPNGEDAEDVFDDY